MPEYTDYIAELLGYAVQSIEGQSPDDLMKKFAKMKSNRQRVAFGYKLKAVHNVLGFESEYCKKSSTSANDFRQAGNKFFLKKSYLSALDEYNKSVLHAPLIPGEGEDKELTLALGNRSAALLHLGKYQLCLDDIELALQTDHPVELQYKLFDRQGKCYMGLKQKQAALESFQKEKQYLALANLDEKRLATWESSLEKQMEKCNEMKETTASKKTEKKVIPKLSTGEHESITGASLAVDLKWSSEKGRHAVAAQDIRVGDVIMVNKPYAAVLLPEYYSSHCYHCLNRVIAPIPCNQCSTIGFCSSDCRDQSWESFHKFECEYLESFGATWCGKIGHLATRLLLTPGAQNVMLYLKNAKNNPKDEPEANEKIGCNQDGVYLGDLHSIYSMETNLKSRTPEGFFDFTVFAIYLVKLLTLCGYFKAQDIDIETDANKILFGAALLHFLLVIQCNSNGITELQRPKNFEELCPEDIGVGMYPTVALLNHSCDPGADLNFYGSNVIVRAGRNLFRKEEIMITYGPLFYKKKKQERQMSMKAIYSFHCDCPACTDNWAQWESLEGKIPMFRCEECRAFLSLEKMKDKKFSKCRKCKHTMDMSEVVGRLEVSHDVYAEGMRYAVGGDLDAALPKLVQHLVLLQRYLCMPWKDLVACQAAIQNIYRLMANTKQYL